MPNDSAREGRALKRAAQLVLATLVAVAISACSVLRVGYEALPWYVSWQLDGYWGLDAVQSEYGSERVKELLRWHRRSELPEYSRWLRRVNERVGAPVDLAEATSWRLTIAGFWERAARRAAPELAELLLTLRPEQVERMKKRMAAENDDYRKEYLPGDAERLARRVKRIEQRIEYYLGEATDEQREIARRMARAMPQNEEIWFRERLARQQDFLALLARLGSPGQPVSEARRQEAQRLLIDYLVSLWSPRDPQRRQDLESAMVASDEITVAVLNSATQRQKTRLPRRLLGWADDLDALAPASVGPAHRPSVVPE